MTDHNLYDDLPYRSLPIEWTAPERLSLASLLYGGPRFPSAEYRVLELGCGDGSNLLPMAFYRQHANFVGVDGAISQIKVAHERKLALNLSNIEFIHSDFVTASKKVIGQFDYIIAHGVFSWVPDHIRDAMLELCVQYLTSNGLLYLNYNTRPGWNVRGMVREFLLAQTAGTKDLLQRAHEAQDVSAKIATSMSENEHPFSTLMANEFKFVCENHVSYVAHEFLAADNHPYWRSEFLSLLKDYGFEYIADADFNYSSGKIPDDLASRLVKEQINGRSLEDTIDLFCYRQLHSPILARTPLSRCLPDENELANLRMASCLSPGPLNDAGNQMFLHPSGYEVEAKEEPIRLALEKLQPIWPRGLRIGDLFLNVARFTEDLKLLQHNGLIELRCIEPGDFDVSSELLNKLESRWGGYHTTPYHVLEGV